jgi:hypothetical protein
LSLKFKKPKKIGRCNDRACKEHIGNAGREPV